MSKASLPITEYTPDQMRNNRDIPPDIAHLISVYANNINFKKINNSFVDKIKGRRDEKNCIIF